MPIHRGPDNGVEVEQLFFVLLVIERLHGIGSRTVRRVCDEPSFRRRNRAPNWKVHVARNMIGGACILMSNHTLSSN